MKGLVVFDLDGTLLRSHLHIVESVQDTQRALCLPVLNNDAIRALIGETSESFYQKIAPGYEDIDGFRALFRERERAVLRERGRLYDGIQELLNTLLREDYMLAVCSNASLEYVELALEATGIRPRFHSVVSARAYASKTQALGEIANTSPCGNVIMVGDTAHDSVAAAANRIPFIFAGYGYGAANGLREACFRAGTPGDILPLVGQITVYAQIAAYIRQMPGARCIGINGVDTSGKSVFADRFAEYLQETGRNAAVVHLDDFHNPKALRQRGENEIDAYIQNAFDLNTLVNELLLPLRRHGEVHKELTLLDLDSDTYTVKRRFDIGTDALMILEGVLLYREPLAELIDYKIFLDIGFDEVLRRAKERDMPIYGEQMLMRYKTKYIPIQQRYLQQYRPKEQSDCVVDNTDFGRPRIMPREQANARNGIGFRSTGM